MEFGLFIQGYVPAFRREGDADAEHWLQGERMHTTLTTRRLGSTDMEITTVGFGAWAIGGGGWAFGWGPQDDEQSIATIRYAAERGINWIDTAAVYGLGHSEEVVRRALAGMPDASCGTPPRRSATCTTPRSG